VGIIHREPRQRITDINAGSGSAIETPCCYDIGTVAPDGATTSIDYLVDYGWIRENVRPVSDGTGSLPFDDSIPASV